MPTTGADIGQLPPGELQSAAGVLSRAFLNNPIERAVFRREAPLRQRQLSQLFFGMLSVPVIDVRGAYLGGELVGVCALTPFARCSLRLNELTPVIRPLAKVGLLSLARFAYWMARWHWAEPSRPHRHLQLLGVEPRVQGTGIGSLLLGWYCDELDQRGQFAYRETDRSEN